MAQRILIVDDDPDVGQLVALILQVAGYTGKCVISGPAALDYLAEHDVDLIFLDDMMPPPHGLEVLRQLQAHPVFRGIPVIMMTARSVDFEKIRETVQESGARDCLLKPFRPADVVQAVQTILAASS